MTQEEFDELKQKVEQGNAKITKKGKLQKFVIIALCVLVVGLLISNISLATKVNDLEARWYDFTRHLYADNRPSDSGAHHLAISDFYYRQYFGK